MVWALLGMGGEGGEAWAFEESTCWPSGTLMALYRALIIDEPEWVSVTHSLWANGRSTSFHHLRCLLLTCQPMQQYIGMALFGFLFLHRKFHFLSELTWIYLEVKIVWILKNVPAWSLQASLSKYEMILLTILYSSNNLFVANHCIFVAPSQKMLKCPKVTTSFWMASKTFCSHAAFFKSET